ncbi:uncharacterized protein [Henckelia pumila]|uniref:uncharacterized protein n=1 Tax=Henckelia pumila TaxID=405737 RepID=UPI003C6E15F8
MLRYLKRKGEEDGCSKESSILPKKNRVEVDLPELQSDPGKRLKIIDFDSNIRERVRRKYYLDGSFQPREHEFPQTLIQRTLRRFNRAWFDEFKWLEYSIEKDAAFCLYCYLFKNELGHQGGGDTFDLLNQEQHIETSLARSSEQNRQNYSIQLNAVIDCIRWLLAQGLPFRGHDESQNSINQDIVRACALETTNVILKELGDNFFSILLDESRDVSVKEQLVVLRFVDSKGCVVERLLGFKHVTSTTAQALKCALLDLLSAHGLSVSKIRGQGYDGASNMQGEINGLKALILKENECAYYVHCFAHQLQLALVVVAKNHINIASLFHLLCNIVNVVGGSCKRHDAFREKQAARIIQALENEEIIKGRGLNQESTLIRPSDTRWGSHYSTLLSLIQMFGYAIDVLDEIVEDGSHSDQRAEALRLVKDMQSFEFVFNLQLMKSTFMQSFEFVFNLQLMKSILRITNDLSLALQRKDQDIGQAMLLVGICKKRIQGMRDDGWSILLDEVSNFCEKFHVDTPNMDDLYVGERRSRRKAKKVTNLHHYQVEFFNTIIDMQLQELNFRFNEVNTELLLSVACLNPSDSFAAFDRQKLVKLAQFYPKDFSPIQLLSLPDQLENFVMDMRMNFEASELQGLGDISRKMVQTRRDVAYPLVYKLVTLALILPVATATVQRAFSAMKIIKNRFRNRMGDEYLNDSLITYVEKDIFRSLSDDVIIIIFRKCQTIEVNSTFLMYKAFFKSVEAIPSLLPDREKVEAAKRLVSKTFGDWARGQNKSQGQFMAIVLEGERAFRLPLKESSKINAILSDLIPNGM